MSAALIKGKFKSKDQTSIKDNLFNFIRCFGLNSTNVPTGVLLQDKLLNFIFIFVYLYFFIYKPPNVKITPIDAGNICGLKCPEAIFGR
jgi:hypothetical protein